MLNKLLCFLGFHKWKEQDALGIVSCACCGDISLTRTKVHRHEFKRSSIVGCEHVVYLREKEDWEK